MAKKRAAKKSDNTSVIGELDRMERDVSTASPITVSAAEGAAFGPGEFIRGLPGDEITADVSYIAEQLRSLATRIDTLILDDQNVKDHGEADLPTHAASLREFGIQRAVVVHRESRKILAGNGTVLASTRNGWHYVPVIWFDGDLKKARAFALADNAVGALAGWNETNLAAIAAENEDLFSDGLLRDMTDSLAAEVALIQQELREGEIGRSGEGETEEDPLPKVTKPEDVKVTYRVSVACKDQTQQIELLAELESRGLECRLTYGRES